MLILYRRQIIGVVVDRVDRPAVHMDFVMEVRGFGESRAAHFGNHFAPAYLLSGFNQDLITMPIDCAVTVAVIDQYLLPESAFAVASLHNLTVCSGINFGFPVSTCTLISVTLNIVSS